MSIPYSLEMNDVIAYVVNMVQPRRYGQIIRTRSIASTPRAKTSGTVMCIPRIPTWSARPHRIRAFEEALEYITGHAEVWLATGREIAGHFLENHYDVAAPISRRNVGRRSAR